MKDDVIEPIDHTELALVKSSWESFLAHWKDVPCSSANESEWVATLDAVQTALKELESDRKELTGPLDKQMKSTNKVFKEVMSPLEELKSLVKGRLAGLQLERDNAAREARKALAEAATEAEAATAISVLTAEVPKAVGVRTSFSWKPIVVDSSLVPRSWLTVNTDALEDLGHAQRANDTMETIPGIRWERVATTTTNGRTKK